MRKEQKNANFMANDYTCISNLHYFINKCKNGHFYVVKEIVFFGLIFGFV